MKTKEQIGEELFAYFSNERPLPNEYLENEQVLSLESEAYKEWIEAEPEDADAIIEKAANEIYLVFAEQMIDKNRLLQEWGVNIETLRLTGDLERMFNFGRSRLMTTYPVVGGVCFPMQVKLSLRERSDGTFAVIPHPIRKEPNLDEYRGYKFTDEDRENLLKTGNLGHTIVLDSAILSFKTEIYLSLDKETNELVALARKSMRIPDTIKGLELTSEDKMTLENGGVLRLYGMRNGIGRSFDADVQVNAERRSLCMSNYLYPSKEQAF